MHPTIKFTAEWSKTSINFLDVTVSLIEGIIKTELYVKHTDSHQYLQSSSCHSFPCKKGIQYNTIQKRTLLINVVMIWKALSRKEDAAINWCERKYFEQQEILRNELLDKEKSQGNDSKLTFNVTYYPVFKHLKSQLKELHVNLACDEDHKNVFPEVPVIGFKNNKNLKSHLVRAALTDINEIDKCEPCVGKKPPCQLCSNMKSTYKSIQTNLIK